MPNLINGVSQQPAPIRLPSQCAEQINGYSSEEAVRELMPAFFDLLRDEPEPAVRVVLGHFVFVYIHPYMEGNGRMGCSLMNAMLASGGYPWTVIPVETRDRYFAALEKASVSQDIADFAGFLAKLIKDELQ